MRTHLRTALLLVAAGCAAWATTVGVVWLSKGAAGGELSLNYPTVVAREIERLTNASSLRALTSQTPSAPKLVLVLGDSTLTWYPTSSRVPDRIAQSLEGHEHGRYEVVSLADRGVSSFEYFALADLLAKARPDVVVLGFNLRSFEPAWRIHARPGALGWMKVSRLIDGLGLPLAQWGLRFDQALLYIGLVQARQVQRWRRLRNTQLRVEHAIQDLRGRLQEVWGKDGSGMPKPFETGSDPARPDRHSAAWLRATFTPISRASTDDPSIRLLGSAVHTLEESGVRTLVVVVPYNVDYLESIGISASAPSREAVEALRSVVEGQGGELLDLHDALPDAGFADASGHFSYAEEIDGPRRVGEAIAERVLEMSEPERGR